MWAEIESLNRQITMLEVEIEAEKRRQRALRARLERARG